MSDEVKAAKPLKQRQRERLAELLEQKQNILAELAPHREAHDRIVNDPALIEARKKIKEANAALAPVEEEISSLARALGGKVMNTESGKYTKRDG